MISSSAKNAFAKPVKMETVNGELFTLTYGAIYKDCGSWADVNTQLDKIIGQRLIEEYLAKTSTTRCADFAQTVDSIAKVAFKLFLGISLTVTQTQTPQEFTLMFDTNPLTDCVDQPSSAKDLWYSNIYCGVIRGALEMVYMNVECNFLSDQLRGDETTEIRLRLISTLSEDVPASDD